MTAPSNVGTEILVIGGGATGLGVARDAVLRGFKTILVEKGDLAHGTSGRYHGLLHSGGRYVVRDPEAARECWQENQILRRHIPSAIEDTGGLFVNLDEDPPDYADKFLAACRDCGIPVSEIDPAEAKREEPLLTDRIRRVFRVPDAACDSFDALHLLAEDIRKRGGQVWLRHRVEGVIVERDRVRGVIVRDLVAGETRRVYGDLVLNAAGPWAGQIAGLAGLDVKVTPGKGTMVAMNSRLVNTIINRCKPPDDGDILVPVGTVSVIGTTEVVVDSPDKYPMEAWEIELLMREGEKLVPGFSRYRLLRAWAGVRPLFKEHKAGADAGDSRLMSRGQSILNHRVRDGLPGMISIVGGKFTTFRLMAEQLMDVACAELRVQRPSVTAETPVEPKGSKYHHLSSRLRKRELGPEAPSGGDDPLICECEFVTQSQVEEALAGSSSRVLNDLRRDTRLGMGPCQGGFCAYRATGLAMRQLEMDAAEANNSLAQFLQERWKGQRPILWGRNLRQTELDLMIYRQLLGVARLPGVAEIELYPSEETA